MKVLDPLFGLTERSNLLFFSYNLVAKQFDYSNAAFRNFFDLPDKPGNYRRLFMMVHPDDRKYLQFKLEDCLKKQETADLEFRVLKSSKEHWLRLNIYLLEDHIAGHAQDITVYKEYNNNLNAHNSKKNAILNILAHDLAGPIGNIWNFAEMMKRELNKHNLDGLNKYVEFVSKISSDCNHLIRTFLNQEFLESEGVQLIKRRAEITGKISTITKKYFEMQQGLKLQFTCHANQDKIYAEIDEDKFLQVINNLISNSMKFTPEGGTISINIEEKENSVLITVADTGIGIPEKFHATLFEKFTPARRTGLKGQHSTGLGMSIIKTIVEWHQGKIWFDSEENKGTSFYIEIPK